MTRTLSGIMTALLLLTACSLSHHPLPGNAPTVQGDKYKGYARGKSLISAQELKRLIDAKDPRLVVLAAENGPDYLLGHIPGALLVERKQYEAPPATQGGVSGNLINAEGFTTLAQELGIDRDSTVVVYDAKYDATRIWWAFFYYGKTDVRVLDGGLQAWKEAGFAVDNFPAAANRKGNYIAAIAYPGLRAETVDIKNLQQNKGGQLWDARATKEFTGEELKKGATRAGRIPGAVHCDWSILKTKANPAEWLSAADLQKIIDGLGYDKKQDQFFYCQSGVRSTQPIFALYLLGWPLDKLHNYDSSWIGWSQDESLPIATGNL